MTPTYSAKGKRRYHYYVSAPMVRGGKGEGIRVPAHDLEALVRKAIADHLRDPAWLGRLTELDPPRDARASASLIDAGSRLAAAVAAGGEGDASRGGSGRAKADEQHDATDHGPDDGAIDRIRQVIDRVTVSRDTVCITFHRAALMEALIESGAEIEPQSANEEDARALTIEVPAQPLRCGKQVRLVVGEVATERRSPDPNLIRLIADAHRWFEDLRTGRAATIAEIASRGGQQVSHVSRTLPLAFLAPDIVAMILDGRQPLSLTAERLRVRRQPLPMDWAAQRSFLLG